MGLGRMWGGMKNAAGGAALAGAIGAKFWLLGKYMNYRKSHNVTESPGWNNSRSFAKLPRRRQREVIYGKRDQLKTFENITYGPNYHRRGAFRPWGN